MLTKRQREIIKVVEKGSLEGLPVTVPGLTRLLGLRSSSSLMPTLRKIEAVGYLRVRSMGVGQSRLIELTGRSTSDATRQPGALPVIGIIAAGRMTEAVQESEETIANLDDALRHKPGDKLLKIKGDSMTGDGILEGDKVLITPCPERDSFNGQIVAVQVAQDDGSYESTLKHAYYKPGQKQMRLAASNKDYEDLEVDIERIEVIGLYDGRLIRSPF